MDKYYEENPIVLDYNTEREKLDMPEYGRNVLKMVEEVKSLSDGDIEPSSAPGGQLGAQTLGPSVHNGRI